MISKVLPAARSFGPCCKYVCQDQSRAEVLKTQGVRSHNYKLMAEDFEHQRTLRPEKHQAVFHAVLSFYPGERVADEKMVEIAEQYLKRIGMINTQYAITKHTDKDHLHLHVIANRVNNEGHSIAENWVGLKAKKVAQELTREHELIAVQEKNLKLTHQQSLQPAEAKRYHIYEAIAENLDRCNNFKQLQNRLMRRGIETQFRHNDQTHEPEGISFRMGKQCFKGSQIDREFSFKGLDEWFEAKQQTKELEHGRSYGRGYGHSHGGDMSY
jgi:hypothetical protein